MKYINKKKNLKNIKFVMDCDDGFVVNPKTKKFPTISITVYNANMINNYIVKNFLYKFKKLLEEFKNDDDSENDENVLTKIENLEWIILNQYKKFLTMDEIKKMLKDVYFIKHKLIVNNSIKTNKVR